MFYIEKPLTAPKSALKWSLEHMEASCRVHNHVDCLSERVRRIIVLFLQARFGEIYLESEHILHEFGIFLG